MSAPPRRPVLWPRWTRIIDCGDELFIRKQFFFESLDEISVLAVLQGTDGTLLLKGVIRKPLRLDDFLASFPTSESLVGLLLDLSLMVTEIRAKSLVHLDVKASTVMLHQTEPDAFQACIIVVASRSPSRMWI